MKRAAENRPEHLDRQALLAEVERLHALIEAQPHGLWEADAEGRLTGFSQRWLDLTGLTRESALDGGWTSVSHPEDLPAMVEAWTRSVGTGEPYDVEHRIRTAGGAYRWMRSRATTRRDGSGEILAWCGSMEDVHERRAAGERLTEAAEAVPALIASFDADLRILSCNRRLLEWFGRTHADFVGHTVQEAVGKGVFAALRPYLERALEGETTQYEQWLDYRGRGRRFMRTTYVPFHGPGGEVAGIDAHIVDDTEARLVQEALADAKARTDAILASADVATWVLDLQNDRLYADRNLARFFAVDEATAQGGPAAAYVARVHPDDQPRVWAALGRASTEGVPYEVEFRIVAEAEERWVTARGLPERDEEGRVFRLPGVVVDVTQLKRAQAALIDANRELEDKVRERTADLQASNEALNGFMYHVAHDLRAPLRSIASTSRIVMEDFGDALPEEAVGQLVRQAKAATRLGTLIDDLLRLSKLARQTVERAPIDLTRMAREVAEESLAAHPGASVKVDVQEGLDAWADPRLLRLALGNLVENAVKYSPEGGTVIVGRHEGGAYFVSDEGIGIDPQYFGKVFEPFQRLHADHEFSGTGIGLSNVRQVMERHGGKIWVESELGKGSTFLFTLG